MSRRSRSFQLLKPGVALMRRLRMPVKLALISLLLLLPLLALLVTTVQRAQADLEFTRGERDGAEAAAAIIEVVVHTQTHRGQTNLVLSGNAAAGTAREATRGRLQTTMKVLDELDQRHPNLDMNTAWREIRPALERLMSERAPTERPAAFAAHSSQVEALQRLLAYVGETSGLLFDPAPASVFLMDMAVERFVPWIEVMGRLRGGGAGLLAAGTPVADTDAVRLLTQRAALPSLTQGMAARVESLGRFDEPAPKGWAEAQKAVADFDALLSSAFGPQRAPVVAAEYFAAGTRAIEAALVFKGSGVNRLQELLTEREAKQIQSRNLALAGSAVGVGLLVYLLLSFYVAVQGALNVLTKSMTAAATGDLTQNPRVAGKDELAEVGSQLARMVSSLSDMVSDIRGNAILVAEAGTQIAADNRLLSGRTEEQASSLEETSVAVREVSSTVAGNANNAHEAKLQMETVQTAAETSSKAMQESVTTIQGLQDSSKRMNDIIGTIDGIAFQTNILALNAAVESARAGEAGRGFAVVASEVRSLAQRSQSAAREIRGLIASSGEQVQSATTRIGKVQSELSRLLGSISSVRGQTIAIADGSSEQSMALEQVVQAIGSLDDITQQNASLVAASTERSNQLQVRAAELRDSVAHVKLARASLDEAKAMAQRAATYLRSHPGDRAAIEDPEGEFIDRDLYVFAMNRQGVFTMFGANPARVSRPAHELPGIDGPRFVADSWAAADDDSSRQGGGWVDYTVLHPTSGKVLPKRSFMIKLDDRSLLGCGAYRSSGT